MADIKMNYIEPVNHLKEFFHTLLKASVAEK